MVAVGKRQRPHATTLHPGVAIGHAGMESFWVSFSGGTLLRSNPRLIDSPHPQRLPGKAFAEPTLRARANTFPVPAVARRGT